MSPRAAKQDFADPITVETRTGRVSISVLPRTRAELQTILEEVLDEVIQPAVPVDAAGVRIPAGETKVRDNHLFVGDEQIPDEFRVTISAGEYARTLTQAIAHGSIPAGATLHEWSEMVHDPETGRIMGSRRYRLPQPAIVERIARPEVVETVTRPATVETVIRG